MLVWIESSTLKPILVFYIFLYSTLIQFIRGGGIELWLIYGLVQYPFTYLIARKINIKTLEYVKTS